MYKLYGYSCIEKIRLDKTMVKNCICGHLIEQHCLDKQMRIPEKKVGCPIVSSCHGDSRKCVCMGFK